ncbi:MAG: hypothetical protein ACXWRE_00785 [Pseudobdellovibrionaceae bacterium]
MRAAREEWKFLLITSCLVAILAVPTFASLVAVEENSQSIAKVLKPEALKTRQPASLPQVGLPKKSVVILDAKKELGNSLNRNLLSYDFSCAKIKTTNFKVEGSFLQLKGKDCAKNSRDLKLSITNQTNGFTASVFLLNKKEYQTDLIQLKEGENKISIQYENPSGQIEEHVLNVKATAI